MTGDFHHWLAAPEGLHLATGDVHIWRVTLTVSPPENAYLRQVLSPEEVERAERFYFEKDRLRWIVAHGALRLLLSQYLQIEPRQLRFEQNAYGKPALLSSSLLPSQHTFQFNLSHSGELALYAFAWDRALGVDVEQMREGIEYEQLAQYHFSAYEYNALLSLPVDLRQQAFFDCWTRKEAYIKARGMGLSLPLQQFDVSLLPGMPAALLASREAAGEVERWMFQELYPGPDYAGAVAVEGKVNNLHCWQFSLT